ncbi:hypothetical protein [Nonomuraea sp. NPDC050643]|uniref:hypothetical protein n=1 Tax=Nonomuraea sp. NPDC050643 TaxID=3155660 RepID=UPI0033FEA781
MAAAGLPAPIADDPVLIRLSSFTTGPALTSLLRAVPDEPPTTRDDVIEYVGPLPGGHLLKADDRVLTAPGCCGDLGDLAGWRAAAEHTGTSPYSVWTGHPGVWVAADGDELRLGGEDDGVPGPEIARLPRTALAGAVRTAAAEVRYFARPLRDACARLAGDALAMRTIIHSSVLDDPRKTARLRELHAAGDLHRVVDEPIQQLLVFDRAVAFVRITPVPYSPGALVIRQQSLITTLIDLFEQTWVRAREIAEPAQRLSPRELEVLVCAVRRGRARATRSSS